MGQQSSSPLPKLRFQAPSRQNSLEPAQFEHCTDNLKLNLELHLGLTTSKTFNLGSLLGLFSQVQPPGSRFDFWEIDFLPGACLCLIIDGCGETPTGLLDRKVRPFG